ncbi:tetratricopeptide repeat protein [Tardiphaga robiniae]|uniref:Tetratricopeptide repeat protein n=1 Tax=Tardiphaga robiniae TaxID=943830 RepID=A0A7G6TZN1_9BRAD|nr:tetratricopeptide repeat protein [Tardiphaga robiniae]QND72213.1 tetratricopeptide repeat protein [Tardiphaga robiniae]
MAVHKRASQRSERFDSSMRPTPKLSFDARFPMSSFRCHICVAVASAALLFVTSLSAQADNACRPPVNQRMIAGCTEIIDNPTATTAERAEAMSYRGAAQIHLGDLDRALADFSTFIAMKPDSAQGYSMRAKVYERLKSHDLAIADYDRAIALDPNYALAYASRGAEFDLKGGYQTRTQGSR